MRDLDLQTATGIAVNTQGITLHNLKKRSYEKHLLFYVSGERVGGTIFATAGAIIRLCRAHDLLFQFHK
jgi:hypothetical protein